jgi:cyclopropane-fatty-acyl-phospholipid synthase
MVEAVDGRRHDDFFATCDRLVRPEGAMLLQAIVIADRSYPRTQHHRDFIRQMIFPGGCLPSVSVLVEGVSRAGDRRVVDLEDIGAHYALTLADWRRNLEASWPTVEGPGVDRRFRRLWTLYLAYCEAAFAERHLSDVQLLVAGSRYETPWLRRPR